MRRLIVQAGAFGEHRFTQLKYRAAGQDGEVFDGYIEVVRFLVENGASVNALEKDGAANVPLHRAAWGGHIEVVRFLVENGADVNPRSYFTTPLDIALSSGHEEVANYLRSQGGIERETY